MRRDEGVAGLNILLAVIIFIFTIGFVVFIFALMGGELESNTRQSMAGTMVNETLSGKISETSPKNLSIATTYYAPSCRDIIVSNQSLQGGLNGTQIASPNYTISGLGSCTITYSSSGATYNNSVWNVTYTYSYDRNTTASQVNAGITDDLSGVTGWFGIIIIITAMVVLILLTVLIISSIRGSGMLGGFAREGKVPTTTA